MITLRASLLSMTLVLFSACDRNTTEDAPPVAAPAAQTNATTAAPAPPSEFEKPPWKTAGEDVQRYDDLVAGKPRQHWIDTYGPSDATDTFFVKDGVHEYQVELRNVFRDDDADFDSVEIHEDTWDEDGYTFVLWSFRKAPDQAWEAVQAMSYSDGVEF